MCEKKKYQFVLLDQFDKFSDGKSTVVVVDLLETLVISTAIRIEEIIPVQSLKEKLFYKGKKGYIVTG